MPVIPILIYLGLCLLVAWRGSQTRIGFWGTFFLSILITPVIMYVALLLLNPSNTAAASTNDRQLSSS